MKLMLSLIGLLVWIGLSHRTVTPKTYAGLLVCIVIFALAFYLTTDYKHGPGTPKLMNTVPEPGIGAAGKRLSICINL